MFDFTDFMDRRICEPCSYNSNFGSLVSVIL